MSGIKNLHSSL